MFVGKEVSQRIINCFKKKNTTTLSSIVMLIYFVVIVSSLGAFPLYT
jgi:hypothetical protein